MASKTMSKSLLRCASKRNYASSASTALKEAKMQSQKLPNGTVVAALDNGSPVTRVTVAFKGGARYEPRDEPGIAHLLRACAGLTTCHSSAFLTSRRLAQMGANFYASSDRECVYYTLETTQEFVQDALECLNNIVAGQEFRPWEIDDMTPKLKYDLASVTPQARAMDLLHRAAFRRNLGNSLYVAKKRIGSISSESMLHFNFAVQHPSNCAVSVVGQSVDKAILVAQNMKLPTTGPKVTTEKSVYYAGEMRKDTGGDLAHIAVGLPGAPLGSPQSLALAVAAKVLGNGPSVKWGTDHSLIAKAVGNVGPFAAAGFNVSYSDSGLVGVMLSVPKNEAEAAIRSVVNVLRKPTLSDKAIQAAKNALKNQILTEADNGSNLAESLALQCLFSGTAKSPNDLADDVDRINPSDVQQTISQAASCKVSVGAVGNLAFVPYVEEL